MLSQPQHLHVLYLYVIDAMAELFSNGGIDTKWVLEEKTFGAVLGLNKA